jgi:hypothetical protein
LEEFKLKVARGRADSENKRTVDEFDIVNAFSNIIIDESIIELKLLLNKPQVGEMR